MGTHPIFESDFDCLTDRGRSSEMSFLRVQSGRLPTVLNRIERTLYNCSIMENLDKFENTDPRLGRVISDRVKTYKNPHLIKAGVYKYHGVKIKNNQRVKMAEKEQEIREKLNREIEREVYKRG